LGEVGKEHVAIAAEKFLESQHDTMPAIAAFSIDADRLLGEIAERRRRTGRQGADHVDQDGGDRNGRAGRISGPPMDLSAFLGGLHWYSVVQDNIEMIADEALA